MTNNKYQIGVSIDAISHVEKNIFRLRLIPDFNSKFSIGGVEKPPGFILIKL